MVALEDELPPEKLPGWDIAYVGVGKVNAAINGAKALRDCNATTLINFGTAGALREGISGLHEVTTLHQRDMDARGLGFALGQTPYEDQLSIDLGRPGLSIGTGDSFANEMPELITDLVDMEAFALAKLAASMGMDFYCFKFVSDQADANAASEWQNTVSHGADLFFERLTGAAHSAD